tara:strand:- start:48 stop:389 length:342 start_codon:yes stop_codon:yes gene_type:complete
MSAQLIKIIVSVICIIAISYFLPWWILSIITLILGYNSAKETEAIINGLIVGFLSWFFILIYMLYNGGDNLFAKMSLILNMKNPILLIIFSSALSGLLGLISSWTGWQFNKRN